MDVDVPETEVAPARRLEGGVRACIPLHVAADFSVPVRPAPTRPVLPWVAVPPRPVNEYGEPRPSESEVGTAWKIPAVTSPSAYSRRP